MENCKNRKDTHHKTKDQYIIMVRRRISQVKFLLLGHLRSNTMIEKV